MVVDFRYGGEEETGEGGIGGHVYVLGVEPRAYFEAGPAAQVMPSHSPRHWRCGCGRNFHIEKQD